MKSMWRKPWVKSCERPTTVMRQKWTEHEGPTSLVWNKFWFKWDGSHNVTGLDATKHLSHIIEVSKFSITYEILDMDIEHKLWECIEQ